MSGNTEKRWAEKVMQYCCDRNIVFVRDKFGKECALPKTPTEIQRKRKGEGTIVEMKMVERILWKNEKVSHV